MAEDRNLTGIIIIAVLFVTGRPPFLAAEDRNMQGRIHMVGDNFVAAIFRDGRGSQQTRYGRAAG